MNANNTVSLGLPQIEQVSITEEKPTVKTLNFTKPREVIPADLLVPVATLLGLYQMNGNEFVLEFDSETDYSDDIDKPLAPWYQYTPTTQVSTGGVEFAALKVINLNLKSPELFPIYVGAADLAAAVEALYELE